MLLDPFPNILSTDPAQSLTPSLPLFLLVKEAAVCPEVGPEGGLGQEGLGSAEEALEGLQGGWEQDSLSDQAGVVSWREVILDLIVGEEEARQGGAAG